MYVQNKSWQNCTENMEFRCEVTLWTTILRARGTWLVQTTRLHITRHLTMLLEQPRQSGHYCLDDIVLDAAREIWAMARQRTTVVPSNDAEKLAVPVRRREIVLADNWQRGTDWLIDVIATTKHTLTTNCHVSHHNHSKLNCVSARYENDPTLVINNNNIRICVFTVSIILW